MAIARAVVNHDDGGGTAPNPLVWSNGSLPKRKGVVDVVRNFAFLPGPVGLWSGEWVSFGVCGITVEDVRVWPYTVSLLVKLSAFLGTLHWPVGDVDLGVGGVSFVELLILFELWAGERLCLERAVPKYRRVGRPISVSAVPFGPGIDIWRSCRLFSAIFRALSLLPGGLGRFLPGVLVLTIVVFGTLVGRSVDMVLLQGHVKLLLLIFWMSFLFFLGILLPLVLVCLQVLYLLGITLRVRRVPTWRLPGVEVLQIFLLLGSCFRVVLVPCLLRWVVRVFAWLVVLVEACWDPAS